MCVPGSDSSCSWKGRFLLPVGSFPRAVTEGERAPVAAVGWNRRCAELEEGEGFLPCGQQGSRVATQPPTAGERLKGQGAGFGNTAAFPAGLEGPYCVQEGLWS